MRRDFSKYLSTDEDRLTFRKWIRGLVILYGLTGLFLVGFVMVRNYQTDVSYSAASPAPTTIATNTNRTH